MRYSNDARTIATRCSYGAETIAIRYTYGAVTAAASYSHGRRTITNRYCYGTGKLQRDIAAQGLSQQDISMAQGLLQHYPVIVQETSQTRYSYGTGVE